MPNPGSLIGELGESLVDSGKKITKEVGSEIAKSINILEGITPPPPPEKMAEMRQKEESSKKSKLASLHQEAQSLAKNQAPKEDRRLFTGTEKVEQGKPQQQGGQQLSANITPKKKPEPLVVQQKRNNKLHGAG